MAGGVSRDASTASSPKPRRLPSWMTKPPSLSHSAAATSQRSAAASLSKARAAAPAWRSGISKARTEVDPAVMRSAPSVVSRCSRHGPTPSSQPSSLGQPVGINGRGRRGLDRDIFPRRAKFVGEDLRERGPDALPGLDLRDDDRDAPVGADLEEMVEHALAGPGAQSAADLARPQGKGDDQPDAGSAPDEQGAAVNLR